MVKSTPAIDHVTGSRLLLLDGLRGFAAIGVVLHHAGAKFNWDTPFSRSYLFVDLFFIMSGFVLAMAAEKRMNEGLGTLGFFRSRIKRLWPTLAVGALIGAAAMAMGSDHIDNLPWLTLLCLLILPAFGGGTLLFPVNYPYWSIFFELIANVMHGLILRRCSDKLLLFFIIIFSAINYVTIIAFSGDIYGSEPGSWWLGLPRLAFSYTLGVWMARIWQRQSYAQIISWQAALILPVITVMLLHALPVERGLGDAIVVTIIIPALFWLATVATVPSSASRLLSWLGALSFPLYVVHAPVLDMVWLVGQSLPMMLLAIACSVAAALLVGWFLEKAPNTNSRFGAGKLRPAAT